MSVPLEADRWLAEAEAGTLLLTATGRLQRHLHDAYARHQAAQGRVVWRTPAIVTWPAWLERMWQERVLSGAGQPAGAGREAESSVLLTGAQSEAVWGQVLAADAGTGEVLHAAGLARLAREAWGLMHAWDLGPAVLSAAVLGARQDAPEAERFAAWAHGYAERTARGGWTDEARLPGLVAGGFAAGALPAPPRVVLAGFDGFDPAQERVLAALAARGSACLELEPPARGASGAAGTLRRVTCAGGEAELELAAGWARAQLEGGAATVGIVVRDLAARRAQVARVFRDVLAPDAALPGAAEGDLPFHLSVGPALAEVPLVRAAFRLLRLGPGPVALEQLEAALLQPYLGGALAEREARGRLLERLRRRGDAALPLSSIVRSADDCPELAARLEAAERLLERQPARQSFAAWAQASTDLLRALGWPGHGAGGRPLSSPEFQAYERWRDLLDAWCGLDLVLPAPTRAEALAGLAGLADAGFQPQAHPVPVQILGHLEAAGLEFDRLWVLGLDDESWPRPPHPHPLLPAAAQRARGLPRASAERVTARLLAAAPEIVCSHAAGEGALQLRASPLIAHLPAVAPEALGVAEAPRLAERIRASARLEPRAVAPEDGEPLARLAPGAFRRSGTGLFEDMAACPFRAQARHRLGADDTPLPEPGLSPADHGRLLHDTLARFWQAVGSQSALHALDASALAATLERALRAALDAFRARGGRLTPALGVLEAERLEKLVRALLELERERRIPFAVTAAEEPVSATLGGLELSLRLDRRDTLADGRQVLLDYKSGFVNPAQWLGERLSAPQLPLYAVIQAEAPAALAFAQVRRGDVKFAGVGGGDVGMPGVVPFEFWRAGRKALTAQSWDEVLAGWRGVLEALGERFRAGAAEVDPQPGACTYCPLPGLCRVDELGALLRPAEGGGAAGDAESAEDSAEEGHET